MSFVGRPTARADATGRLRAEVDRYERVIDSLKALRDRDGRDRLHELVRVRRVLAQQIVELRDAGLAAFADQPERLSDFRSRLSMILHGTALHQADWPAVTLDANAAGYRRSASALGEDQRRFIVWLREALEQTR